jgi:cytidylate kinase
MLRRDKNDSERVLAPLRPAEDSVIIDTTDLNLEQSFIKVAELIRGRLGNEDDI